MSIEENIREILEKQQYKCKYSGVNLCYGKGKIFQPSIDNSKGYTPDNIYVVSWAINDAKNDLSMEDFKLMIVGTYNNINNFKKKGGGTLFKYLYIMYAYIYYIGIFS